MTPELWAQENRIMPRPIPGRYNPDLTPYINPLCQKIDNPQYSTFVAVMGVQMGKTSSIFNIMGWTADEKNAPQIYIGPSKNNIDAVIAPKFLQMIRECKVLNEKYARGKVTSKYNRIIGDVSVRFGWAGSAAEVASDSAWLTVVDELDRPDANATGEGDLVELARARGEGFIDSKLVLASTPTEGQITTLKHPSTGIEHFVVMDANKIVSPIWKEWQAGSRHEWAIPCTECKAYFIPRKKYLWWPKDCTPSEAEKYGALKCPSCGELIQEKDRVFRNQYGRLIAPGEWVNEQGEVQGEADTADNSTFSFWVSGLCSFSPKKTYGVLAKRLREAEINGDPEKLRAVTNTGFGELYFITGERPTREQVIQHRTSLYTLDNIAPIRSKILRVTVGVDVQKDRLFYVIRAWGEYLTSWLIGFGELIGDTDKPPVWLDLDGIVNSPTHGQQIDLAGIDSGYRTDDVYAFCRQNYHNCMPTKGKDRLSGTLMYATAVDINFQGQRIKAGVKLRVFDTDRVKQWIHSRLNWALGKPGAFHLPDDITEDYCDQLVSEERIIVKGKPVWIMTGSKNHYFDCEGLAYIAMRALDDRSLGEGGAFAVTDSSELAQALQNKARANAQAAPAAEPQRMADDLESRLRGEPMGGGWLRSPAGNWIR